ncbi:MAG TPA: CU044_2847 family protein [Rhizomicrobium sp.]|jgi:hypothetical protein
MADTEAFTFYIEVQRPEGEAFAQGVEDRFVEATEERLRQVGQLIEKSCSAFVKNIAALSAKPSELGLEFGVTVEGKAGVPFVTQGSLSGNFKVTLKWEL